MTRDTIAILFTIIGVAVAIIGELRGSLHTHPPQIAFLDAPKE